MVIHVSFVFILFCSIDIGTARYPGPTCEAGQANEEQTLNCEHDVTLLQTSLQVSSFPPYVTKLVSVHETRGAKREHDATHAGHAEHSDRKQASSTKQSSSMKSLANFTLEDATLSSLQQHSKSRDSSMPTTVLLLMVLVVLCAFSLLFWERSHTTQQHPGSILAGPDLILAEKSGHVYEPALRSCTGGLPGRAFPAGLPDAVRASYSTGSAAALPQSHVAALAAPLTPFQLPPTAGTRFGSRPSSNVSVPGHPDGGVIGPPAICPSLILPRDEARFMVPSSSLRQQVCGPIDVFGTSGRKLMQAAVQGGDGNPYSFSIASVGCEGDPRCTVRSVDDARTSSSLHELGILEVFGRSGKPYGILEPISGGSVANLYCNGLHVMTIKVEDWQRMIAVSVSGEILATAGPRPQATTQTPSAMRDEMPWRVEVKPRVDAVLVVSCMLSVLLLWPLQLPSGRHPLSSMHTGLATTPQQ